MNLRRFSIRSTSHNFVNYSINFNTMFTSVKQHYGHGHSYDCTWKIAVRNCAHEGDFTSSLFPGDNFYKNQRNILPGSIIPPLYYRAFLALSDENDSQPCRHVVEGPCSREGRRKRRVDNETTRRAVASGMRLKPRREQQAW